MKGILYYKAYIFILVIKHRNICIPLPETKQISFGLQKDIVTQIFSKLLHNTSFSTKLLKNSCNFRLNSLLVIFTDFDEVHPFVSNNHNPIHPKPKAVSNRVCTPESWRPSMFISKYSKMFNTTISMERQS